MLNSPPRLAIYAPLVSLINMFIYVLKYPTLPTTQSDIALMDVAVGHFGRLEFASSDLAFPCTREMTSLARVMVRKTREGIMASEAVSPPSENLMRGVGVHTSLGSSDGVSFS